jgi:hypothetical protein
MKRLGWGWLVAVLLVPNGPVRAQISGFNLFEFQAGNTPFTDPADLTSGYDRMARGWSAGCLPIRLPPTGPT